MNLSVSLFHPSFLTAKQMYDQQFKKSMTFWNETDVRFFPVPVSDFRSYASMERLHIYTNKTYDLNCTY